MPGSVSRGPSSPVMNRGSKSRDVGVAPDHDLAARRVQRLPQRLALAVPPAVLDQHLGGGHHPGPGGGGLRARAVGRVVVDDHDLVDEAEPVDQLGADGRHDGPDGRLLVAGGDAHRHRGAPLGGDEHVDREVGGVVGAHVGRGHGPHRRRGTPPRQGRHLVPRPGIVPGAAATLPAQRRPERRRCSAVESDVIDESGHDGTTAGPPTAEQAELFRLAAEATTDMVLLGRPGLTEWISPSVEELLGYSPEEFVALGTDRLVHPDDLPRVLAARPPVAHGEPVGGRCRVLHRDGTYRWLEARVRPLPDPDGTYRGRSVSTWRAVDREVEAMARLRESEERYRLLVENVTDGVALERDGAAGVGLAEPARDARLGSGHVDRPTRRRARRAGAPAGGRARPEGPDRGSRSDDPAPGAGGRRRAPLDRDPGSALLRRQGRPRRHRLFVPGGRHRGRGPARTGASGPVRPAHRAAEPQGDHRPARRRGRRPPPARATSRP